MEKLLKKYKDVLIPLVPGEDLPGIDGKYLSTNSLLTLFKKEYPDGFTKTAVTAYEPAVYVTVTCDVYADANTLLATRSKTKVFICNDPVDEEAQIAQAQSGAVWQALSASGIGLDFTVAAEVVTRQASLERVDEIREMREAGKTAIISENEEMTPGETFDALLAMSAAREPAKELKSDTPKVKTKAKKEPEPEPQEAEPEAPDDDDDPFAEEGILPPEPAEEPEDIIEIEEPAPEPEPPEVHSDDPALYIVQTEDFVHERYGRNYAGKALKEISEEELAALYSYGDKAITPQFTEVLKEYLKV